MRTGTAMRNMTVGSCWKSILLFALPMLAGNLLQQCYNLVDSWAVGNYVGDSALAAVGTAYPVLFLYISIFQGVSTGSTVVIPSSSARGAWIGCRTRWTPPIPPFSP